MHHLIHTLLIGIGWPIGIGCLYLSEIRQHSESQQNTNLTTYIQTCANVVPHRPQPYKVICASQHWFRHYKPYHIILYAKPNQWPHLEDMGIKMWRQAYQWMDVRSITTRHLYQWAASSYCAQCHVPYALPVLNLPEYKDKHQYFLMIYSGSNGRVPSLPWRLTWRLMFRCLCWIPTAWPGLAPSSLPSPSHLGLLP